MKDFNFNNFVKKQKPHKPEGLAASALQIARLEHLALAVRGRVQHHQVEVHLVTAIPVLTSECVGSCIAHLKQHTEVAKIFFFL